MTNLFSRVGLVAVVAFGLIGASFAQGNGQGNGDGAHFDYSGSLPDFTFAGQGGGSQSGSFTVTNPTDPDHVSHDAHVKIAEIDKVPLVGAPVNVTGDPIGAAIKSNIVFNPSAGIDFEFPGNSKTIVVTMTNPNVSADDYGTYSVQLKMHDDSQSGVGESSGIWLNVILKEPTATDTTPPIVAFNQPTGSSWYALGPVNVVLEGFDPTIPPPATGLNTLSASVVSAGLIFGPSAIPLTNYADALLTNAFNPQPGLPVAAGVHVWGSGSFVPTGGLAGSSMGTTLALAFSSSSRSGIGFYTFTGNATDVAGNVAVPATASIEVRYNITWTMAHKGGSNLQFHFTANRSATTSDGAFMFDKTVKAELLDGGGNVLATHYYGTASVNLEVQIVPNGSGGFEYQTHFLSVGGTGPYSLRLSFMDVDGVYRVQDTKVAN